DDTTRTKRYEEVLVAEKLQADCDLKATNIIVQGLPPDVYAIVNHHKFPKKYGTDPSEYKVSEQSTTRMEQVCDGRLVVLVFNQGDDPITYLNKAMSFLIVVVSSRFPSTNNQLRTSSNLRNHATILDGKPKRPRNAAWFKENAMLAEAQESGQILDEEQLAFLVDLSIPNGQYAQTTILNTAAFHTEDLDAYDSDCDDVSNAKAVLMANLSNYGSDVILEVPHFEPNHTDMDNQSVHAIQSFKQTTVVDFTYNEITSDSNIISYSQYLQETKQKAVQDNNLYAQQDSMILSVIEQISVISSQHAASIVIDDEETLILKEVSQSKMLAKQNDPMLKEKKVNTTPINYVELNRLSEDFSKCFVPQQELSDEQAFWLQTSHPNTDQSALSPVKIEAPKELPKISLITSDAITEGEWGFEHTKTVLLNE
ncbi:hypothetical protein Tco_1085521, partial [Tanacetum coccineum]